MTGQTQRTARQAGTHPLVTKGARLGYAANGLINVLIGWIALQLALTGGGTGQDASASGALRTVAQQPFGAALLWVVLLGLALLAVWQVVEAVLGSETADRVKAAGKAVTYAVLAGLTWTVVSGAGSPGGGSAEVTSTLMAQPFGRVLVALVGLGIAAVGAYGIHKGWTRKFLHDLQERPAPWVVTAGRVGYVARGVSFVVLGGLFVIAAWTSDAQRAGGLDSALQALLELPFGRIVLGLVAVGFIAFGVYSFARARYADIRLGRS